MLSEAGVTFDFVGTQSEPYATYGVGGSYGCPTAFDQDHEGYWGHTVDDVADLIILHVEALQPDAALIHLGTNGTNGGEDPAATADEMEALLGSRCHPSDMRDTLGGFEDRYGFAGAYLSRISSTCLPFAANQGSPLSGGLATLGIRCSEDASGTRCRNEHIATRPTGPVVDRKQ